MRRREGHVLRTVPHGVAVVPQSLNVTQTQTASLTGSIRPALSATQTQTVTLATARVASPTIPPPVVTVGRSASRRAGGGHRSGVFGVYQLPPNVFESLAATQAQTASLTTRVTPGKPLAAAQVQTASLQTAVTRTRALATTQTQTATLTRGIAGPLGFKSFTAGFPTISVGPLSFSGASQDGTILPTTGLEPVILYDGTKFQMWYHGAAAGESSGGLWQTNGGVIYYCTSTDGVSWGTPTLVINRPAVGQGCSLLGVAIQGGTYHMLLTIPEQLGYDYYTSPDGATWTLVKQAVLGFGSPDANWQYSKTPTNVGWDGYRFGNITFRYDTPSSQWIIYYEATESGTDGTWRIGMATGPDLQHITKNANSPIFDLAPGGLHHFGRGIGGPEIHRVGGVDYMFLHETDASDGTIPTSIALWQSSNAASLSPTWTRIGWIHRNYNDPSTQVQVADPSVVEVAGVTHLYWEQLGAQNALPDICHASYPGTLAQFVQAIGFSPISEATPTTNAGQVVLTTNVLGTVTPITMDGVAATPLGADPGASQAAGTYWLSGTTLKLGTAGKTHVTIAATAVTQTQNLSVTQAQTATVTTRATLARSLPTTQTQGATISVRASLARSFAATQAQNATIAPTGNFTRSLPAVQAQTAIVTARASLNRSLSTTQTQGATISVRASVSRSFSTVQTQSATLGRVASQRLTLTLTTTETQTASLGWVATRRLTLAATQTQTIRLTSLTGAFLPLLGGTASPTSRAGRIAPVSLAGEVRPSELQGV